MKNTIQRKILAAATVLAGCVTAHAYNLAWLDEKAEAGVPFVTNTIADAGSYKSTTGAYYAFANSACWTDNQMPHENAVYFNGGLQMRLDTVNYSFPGDGFILTDSILYMHQKAAFCYVGVEGDARIQTYQKITAGLKDGVIDIASGKRLTLMTSISGRMEIDSAIRGAGDVTLTLVTGTDAPGSSTHTFAGINTDWTGSLLLKTGYVTSRKYPTYDKGYVTFKFSDGRALGGRKESFAQDALTLASFARFTPTASTQLADGLNRGLYVGDSSANICAGVFYIDEGITLTNHWPMTVNGTVYKEGPGTLELASDCRFPDDQVPDDADRHTLMLSNGIVRVSHADALNGLIVDVSSGLDKALALDLSKTEGDLFVCGIRNTKTATPFVGDKLPIVFENATLENLAAIYAAGGTFGVVTVADAAADATEAQLEVLALPDVYGCTCSLVRVPNGDDTTTFALKLEYRGAVRYVGVAEAPSSASKCRDLTQDWPSPFGLKEAWSDHDLPHQGPVYVAGLVNDESSVLWTPIQSEMTVYDAFSTLVLETGCTLCLRHEHNRAAVFGDLRISGRTAIWGPNVDTEILAGNLFLSEGARLSVCTYNNRNIRIDSNVSGPGDIRFSPQSGTSAYKCNYSLTSCNTNFSGRIEVSSDSDATLTSNYAQLTITNAYNLGGNLPEFVPNALSLANKAQLTVKGGDLTLSAESNRGILVSTRDGRLNVPTATDTFTVDWPVTMGPVTLWKEGAGRLVLGRPLRFWTGDESVENPVAGKAYAVEVTAGTLAVTDCNALNGAKLSFADGTALVVSADASGDLKANGARFDKIAEPFATDVPIRIEATDPAALTETSYSVGLVTVKAVDAESVKLSATSSIRGYKVTSVTSAPGAVADTVTFTATLEKHGLMLILR